MLNQLTQRFNKVVQNPVNAVCLDNPDSLLVCAHGLVGVFLPTTEEYKNTDHLLRRLWLSRMVYSEHMMPLVIIDKEKWNQLNLDVLGLSFGNMMPFENIDDAVRFINGRVDNVKGLSQKVRQDAFMNYYYILEYLRSREVKPLEQFDNIWFYGESIPVRSWSRNIPTYIRNTIVDDNQNQIDVWRIYLLTPTEHDRARFSKLLTGTIHENIYNQLLERVPNLEDLEHGQFKYFDILKEYVFDKQPVKGVIIIDKGSYNAMRRGARLFPVGILKVSGDFDYGDLVQIECSGHDAFISIVEANSEYLRDNKGKRTDDIMELTQTTQIPVVSRKKYRYRKKIG